MFGRRTAAERDQDRKLAFVPLWPLVGALALIVLAVVLLG
jgi:predicted nucleic acid-binding Zn ribbon protein